MRVAPRYALSGLARKGLLWLSLAVLGATDSGCSIRQAQPPEIEQQIESKLVTFMQQGVSAMRRGDLSRAEANFALARELKSSDARVLDGYGCLALRQGNYNLAKSYFKQAISVDPMYSRPYAHLAIIARQNGELQAANELLVAALTLNPLNSWARGEYSRLLKLLDSTRANEELMKAYALGAGRNEH